MIEVGALTHSYGSFKAVEDVSFKLEKGEVVGFLGPNGAGKTTTMKVLAGYLSPLAGKVVVAGHDVLADPEAVKRSLGYLAEHNPLYVDMTVHGFLDYVGSLRGLERRARTEAVLRAADRTGIRAVLDQPIGELSKGFRQRTGLAAALLHDPPVLILDEPTSGLDPVQVQHIRALIREVGATRTVLFSTHVLSEVEATCKRAIVISAGKIVGDGPIDDLKRKAARGAIRVRFKPGKSELPASEELVATVAKLEAAAKVKAADGTLVVEPKGHDPEPLSSEIFSLAVDKGWTLLELAPIQASLEEVFLALTGNVS
jgi:ABC-2 type transport system ATP-binding protein